MTSKNRLDDKIVKEWKLKDLKKSNQARKIKLAIKAGFKTVQEYYKYLTGKDMPVRRSRIKKEVIGFKVDVPKGTIEEVHKVTKTKSKVKPTDIVIAFDTTGSMSSYIGDVKKHVINLIPDLFKNTTNLQISLVAFGDYCDIPAIKQAINAANSKEGMATLGFGKAYQVHPLSTDENSMISWVKEAQNTSGGDGDEFYDLVLYKIRTETNWRKDSNKSILLIADATCHHPNKSRTCDGYTQYFNWCDEAKELAKSNIKVDTLSITGQPWYVDLSNMTNGINLLFSSSQKTSQLLEGYTYARSGSRIAFSKSYSKVEDSGDTEMTTVYNQLFKTL